MEKSGSCDFVGMHFFFFFFFGRKAPVSVGGDVVIRDLYTVCILG